MIDASKITPVILAGGMGMRLRPLTSEASPKPFLRLFSDNSLFQDTVIRALSFGAPLVLCHENSHEFVTQQLAEINVKPRAIILEPAHKGTASAIALAALYLRDSGQDMLVMPSDHVLEGSAEFDECIYSARRMLDGGGDRIVMLGAKPTDAETGYGYMITADCGGRKVVRFVEKPDRYMAEQLIKDDNCLWNTGIFMARPSTILAELGTYAPEIHAQCTASFSGGRRDGNAFYPAIKYFTEIKSISIDYAILEQSRNIYACNMPLFWSDAGTWPRMMRLKEGVML